MRAAVVGLAVLLRAVAAATPVEVTVDGVAVDSQTGTPVVRLVERGAKGDTRELPIWIGPFEAQAILLEMRGAAPTRPMTHDLMKSLVERLGGRLRQVVIDDLRDDTYFAKLHLEASGGREVIVDARPSDAIALALRLKGTILVSEELFGRVPAGRPAESTARLWGLTLQDLTPEIAGFFQVPEASGVLVSDVESAGAAHEAARGDVITAIDGVPVASVQELASRAGIHPEAEPVRLSIRRGKQQIQLTFTDAAAR